MMVLFSVALSVSLASPTPGALLVSPAPDPGAMYPVDTVHPAGIPTLPPGVTLRDMNATITNYHISIDASGSPIELLDLREDNGRTLTARLALPLRIDGKLYPCSGTDAIPSVQVGHQNVCRTLPTSVVGREIVLLYWIAPGSASSTNLIVDQIFSRPSPVATSTP